MELMEPWAGLAGVSRSPVGRAGSGRSSAGAFGHFYIKETFITGSLSKIGCFAASSGYDRTMHGAHQ